MSTDREATLVLAYASVEANPDAPDPLAGEVLIEARLTWGADVLAVSHVAPAPGRSLAVGDLRLPPLPRADMTVARVDGGGRVSLVLPDGTSVPERCRTTVRLGRAALRLAIVARSRERIAPSMSDGRVARGVLIAAMLHAAVFAAAFEGRVSDADEELSARAAMQGYLAAADQRALEEAVALVAPPRPEPSGSGAASEPTTVVKDEGAAGNPARTNEGARARTTRGDRPRAQKSGPEEISFASLIGLITAEPGDRAGSSAWAKEVGPAAMGNIFGATIDDANGLAGLGLSGAGQGGGGKGEGVALGAFGSFGTCGDDCVGTGAGYGRGIGRMGGTHVTRAPVLRCGEDTCTAQVNGRLPPEAVQRVVRDNFGRLRACYEQGLVRDPGLEGRIAVKFVIDREGAVALTSTDERSLADASVAACVGRSFSRMTFPKPAGGIVTVVYPVVFSTSP